MKKEFEGYKKFFYAKSNENKCNISGSKSVDEIKYKLDKHVKNLKATKDSLAIKICNCLLVATVVQVNIVGFWRGLFGILSFFHDYTQLSLLFFFGGILQLQFTIWRHFYKKYLNEKKIIHFFLRKIYAYACGSSGIVFWVGLWSILEEKFGLDVCPPFMHLAVCYAVLLCLKLSKTVLAAPCSITADSTIDEFFDFNTAFKTKFSKGVILDIIFSCVIIAPAVIGYWRGTWCLSDTYIFPNNFGVNLIVSGVIGLLVQIAFTLAQECFQKSINPKKLKIFYYVISRLYTYIYGLACVNMWRGGWKALDFYCGTEFVQVLVPTTISFVAISCMKTIKTLSSSPFTIALDSYNNYFQVPTMFKVTKSSELSLYILDCFFSVFVIGSLVIFIWRGVWCLTDVLLFPENEKYSAVSSLVIGYSIVLVIFILQTPIEKINEKLSGFWQLLISDVYVFISFIGTINLWRGIWNLLNIYFLPEFPIWSYWITHLGCFSVLVLINCSNTILVRGVYLDGEEGGKCNIFPTFYFSFFFQELQRKKTKENESYQVSFSNNNATNEGETSQQHILNKQNNITENLKGQKTEEILSIDNM